MTTIKIKNEDSSRDIPEPIQAAIAEFLISAAQVFIPKIIAWIKDGTRPKYITSDGKMYYNEGKALKHQALEGMKGNNIALAKIEYPTE